MAPPDWNWADFCGSRLVQAIARHGHRFPEGLREDMIHSIDYACEAIIRRNVGPDYTNIAIIGAFVTRIAGEQLGREDYAAYGLERLRKLHAHTMEHGAFRNTTVRSIPTLPFWSCRSFSPGPRTARSKH